MSCSSQVRFCPATLCDVLQLFICTPKGCHFYKGVASTKATFRTLAITALRLQMPLNSSRLPMREGCSMPGGACLRRQQFSWSHKNIHTNDYFRGKEASEVAPVVVADPKVVADPMVNVPAHRRHSTPPAMTTLLTRMCWLVDLRSVCLQD